MFLNFKNESERGEGERKAMRAFLAYGARTRPGSYSVFILSTHLNCRNVAHTLKQGLFQFICQQLDNLEEPKPDSDTCESFCTKNIA